MKDEATICTRAQRAISSLGWINADWIDWIDFSIFSRYELYFIKLIGGRATKLVWIFHELFPFQVAFSPGSFYFFLLLASSDRPKFLAFSTTAKKSNDVVKAFFTRNNSFNLKNEHSNSIEKNRNKNRNISDSILCILLIHICEC